MSKKLTLCLLFLSILCYSQSPQLINYQGVARDANGVPIIGTVGLKFELRQGSVTSPTVFTETQSVSTNSFGVFNTQIGKVPGSGLGNVNWQGGDLFLEISLSPSGGTFTSMGTQQLVSVPYALLAKSVPASYTNNILTIGAQAFTLSPPTGTVYTAGTGISIASGSVITNTSPDIPITFTSGSSNIAVTGPYPNFSLSYTATPVPTSLTLNGATNTSLSAGNNTVVLNSYTVGSGLNMTGGPNYTITSSAATPTIQGAGLAAVSPSTGSSFTVSVPNPSIALAGTLLTLTQGTSVSTATLSNPSLTLGGTNNNNLTAGNNTVTLNTYTTGSGLSMTGGPNYTITSTATAPSLTLTGASNNNLTAGNNTVTLNTYTTGTGLMMTGGPNYTISSPNPSVTVAGTLLTLTQGTAVSTATLANPSLTLSGANNNNLTAGNNTVTLNTYTTGAGLIMTGGPNYTITSAAATPSIQGAGVAAVSPLTGSSFTVTVPNPSVAVAGTLLTLTQGASTSTAALNTFTPGTGITITGGPNYTISSTAATPSIQGAGVAVVSPTTGSAFTVTVPNPNVSVAGTTLTLSQGTAVSTAALPTTTVTGSGIATVIPSGLVYNVNVASPSIMGTGATTVLGGFPSYTINTPLPQTTTITGTGAAAVTPSTGLNFVVDVPLTSVSATTGIATIIPAGTNSFNVNVPAPLYNPLTGALNTGTASTSILQTLTFTNNILTSGPSTNSVLIPASINTSIFPAGSASVAGFFPSFTVSAPPSPTITGSGLAIVSPSTGANITVNVPALSYTSASGVLGSGTNTVDITAPLTFTNSILTSGPASNSINLGNLSPFTSTGTSIYQVALSNSVGIGTSAPGAKLDVVESATYTGTHLKVQNGNSTNASDMVNFSSNGNGYALNVFNNNASASVFAAFIDGGLRTRGKTTTNSGYAIRATDFSSNDLFVVRNDGNVGIGTANPAAMLHVNSNSATFDGIAADMNNMANGGTALQIRHFGIGNAGYFEVNNTASNAHAIIATSNSGSQHSMRVLNTSTSSTAYAGMFEGGLVGRGKNSATDYALKAMSFGGSDMFVVRNDGNVGIGINTPNAPLQFSNTIVNRKIVLWDNNNNDHQFYGFGINNGSIRYQVDQTLSDHVFYSAVNATTSQELMRIMGTGNVGIGTSAPATKLHVHSSTSNVVQARLTHTATTSFGLVLSTDNLSAALLNYDNTPMYFGTNGANRMVITAAGAIGVGTITPTHPIQLTSAVSNSATLRVDNSGGGFAGQFTGLVGIGPVNNTPGAMLSVAGGVGIGSSYYNAPAPANGLLVEGKVGIGNSSPTATLHVTGTTRLADGTEGVGKVLTSDASGNASWQQVGVPSGAVMAYAGATVPTGWLLCDGASYNRAGTYANLFAAIGTAWGAPSGTTFNVPDMRGMFLRGVDGGSGNDPDAAARTTVNSGGNSGNNVGSEQQDDFESHNHSINNAVPILGGLGLTSILAGSGTTTTGSTGGSTETRPKNVYVYYIIKQ